MWSTLLAYLVFRDFPDGGSLIGMAVIVFAGLLAVNWKQMRRISDATDSPGSH